METIYFIAENWITIVLSAYFGFNVAIVGILYLSIVRLNLYKISGLFLFGMLFFIYELLNFKHNEVKTI